MSAAAARIGEVHAPFGASQAVATRPCRACGAPCDVTEAGMFALKTCNRILLARGDMPISETKTFACDACVGRVREASGEENRRNVDLMRAAILDLKDAIDPASEKGTIEVLKELGHPDVPGLLLAIAEKRAESKGKGKRS